MHACMFAGSRANAIMHTQPLHIKHARAHVHTHASAAPIQPQSLMRGMSTEPSGCITAGCGSSCASGMVAVGQISCPDGSSSLRCCPAAPYPDVFLWTDRGISSCYVDPVYTSGLDTTLLSSSWSNVREFQVLPGEQAGGCSSIG